MGDIMGALIKENLVLQPAPLQVTLLSLPAEQLTNIHTPCITRGQMEKIYLVPLVVQPIMGPR